MTRRTRAPAPLLVGAFWIRGALADVQHEVSLLRRDLSQIQATGANSIACREWTRG